MLRLGIYYSLPVEGSEDSKPAELPADLAMPEFNINLSLFLDVACLSEADRIRAVSLALQSVNSAPLRSHLDVCRKEGRMLKEPAILPAMYAEIQRDPVLARSVLRVAAEAAHTHFKMSRLRVVTEYALHPLPLSRQKQKSQDLRSNLSPLNDASERRLREMASLQSGWDGGCAEPINELALKMARLTVQFYVQMMRDVFQHYNPPPFEFAAGLDGEVDLRLVPLGPGCINVCFGPTKMSIYEARFKFKSIIFKYSKLPVWHDAPDAALLAEALCVAVNRSRAT
ncbi:MAG: hypothetical protein AB7P49_03160 [Bdellovibrionales bacterium]